MYSYKFGSGRRLNDSFESNNPDPGAYDQSKLANNKHKSAQYSFGKNERSNNEKQMKEYESVGPGSYELPTFLGKSPSSKFNLEMAEKQLRSITPGPGNYDILKHSTPKIKNKYSNFGMSSYKHSVQDSPGPGSYKYTKDNVSYIKNPNKSWTTEKRIKEMRDDLPGPGNYNNFHSISMKYPYSSMWKFGTAERMRQSVNESQDGPGPGSYTTSPSNQSPGVTMKSRYPPGKKNDFIPGPGTYYKHNSNLHDSFNKLKDIHAKSPRFIVDESKNPSPGEYQPTLWNIDKSKQIKMTTSKRPELNNHNSKNIPGPGTYENLDNSVRIGYSMASRYENARKENTPSPDKYYVEYDVRKPATIGYRIGTSPRSNFTQSGKNVPGPGQYSLELSPQFTKSKGTFGTAEKKSSVTTNQVPGPGEYPAMTYVGNIPKYETLNKKNERRASVQKIKN